MVLAQGKVTSFNALPISFWYVDDHGFVGTFNTNRFEIDLQHAAIHLMEQLRSSSKPKYHTNVLDRVSVIFAISSRLLQ